MFNKFSCYTKCGNKSKLKISGFGKKSKSLKLYTSLKKMKKKMRRENRKESKKNKREKKMEIGRYEDKSSFHDTYLANSGRN